MGELESVVFRAHAERLELFQWLPSTYKACEDLFLHPDNGVARS